MKKPILHAPSTQDEDSFDEHKPKAKHFKTGYAYLNVDKLIHQKFLKCCCIAKERCKRKQIITDITYGKADQSRGWRMLEENQMHVSHCQITDEDISDAKYISTHKIYERAEKKSYI